MSAPPLQRILYVEDDPDIRMVTQISLELVGGFEVLACSDGASAIAQGPAFAPQLILSDVMMPDMDGPETVRRLRELPALAQCPFLFFTAKMQEGEVAALKAQGAAAVLAKPFDAERLPDQIRAIWGACHV